MKSRIAVCIFSLSVAVLSLTLSRFAGNTESAADGCENETVRFVDRK